MFHSFFFFLRCCCRCCCCGPFNPQMMVMYENSSNVLHAHLLENCCWCTEECVPRLDNSSSNSNSTTKFTSYQNCAPLNAKRNTHNRRQLRCNFCLVCQSCVFFFSSLLLYQFPLKFGRLIMFLFSKFFLNDALYSNNQNRNSLWHFYSHTSFRASN